MYEKIFSLIVLFNVQYQLQHCNFSSYGTIIVKWQLGYANFLCR